MGPERSAVNRRAKAGLPCWTSLLSFGAAILVALLCAPGGSAAPREVPSRTYDLVITYAGTLQNSDMGGGYSSAVTLKFSMSQSVEVEFPAYGVGAGGAGTAKITDTGPASFSASGSVTSSIENGDNCTISAPSAPNVNAGVTSGSVTSGKDTIDASAAMPLSVSQPGNSGGLVLSGSNDNCADLDTAGLAPDPPAQYALAYQSAELPMVADINVSKIPYSKSFPVQWTTADSTGGTDTVQISDDFTVTGACSTSTSGMSCSCPNPADDPLPAEAQKAADSIFKKWVDPGDEAENQIKGFGARIRREFPDDRTERKLLINREFEKLTARLKRLYPRVKRDLEAAQARDIAHAKCPHVKQKIREIYSKKLAALDTDYEGDLRFLANEVIATVSGGCGCHT